MARRRMMSEVPKADIVVTNPTHFAVALQYRDGEMRAPRVVAKGTELVALRIRELAREHSVPLLEAPPLTRALYRHCDLGERDPRRRCTPRWPRCWPGLYQLQPLAQRRRRRAAHAARPAGARLARPGRESRMSRRAAPTRIPQRAARRVVHECHQPREPRCRLAAMAQQWLRGGQAQGLVGPVLIVMILAMMVLPLPPFLLDLLFTFNIALSIMVLLVSMYTMKALDFAAFPSVLLFTTLLRLSLNVASTRVVLMEGHTGPDAAGKVIEAFGHFLVGGNFAVGTMVFIILVVINFMVITKGAGRIAEVGARFALDAMPGKQMAIDADLNAGLISEDVARKRRAEVAQEADFYGSMDGASKFVRGDAVAGLLIMVINIIGGLVVGMLQHDLDFATAGRTYTLLAIGDGLVAQIPALVISTAAGVIVSRVATDEDVGRQLTGQLFSNPQVLFLDGRHRRPAWA